jgi:FtsP/CotA-like multicopper oxidase with cupredoxin domain
MRRGDTLFTELTITRARWSPEGPRAASIDVAAIAEGDGPPMIPAPLLRVATGTVLQVRVRNAMPDSSARVFGLWTHPSAGTDTTPLRPGESRMFIFEAGVPGTYMYGARDGRQTDQRGSSERETALGAFVVDPPGPVPPDRIFVMNIWGSPLDSLDYSNALAINGLSWPLTERLTATTGDTLRWRVVNATARSHPMHLHGFYFTLLSKGGATVDTLLAPNERFDEVTDKMLPFSTLAMEWSPTRAGNWLFHCHIAYHVIPEAAQLNTRPDAHAAHSASAAEHMRGLVLGISVNARSGDQRETRNNVRRMHVDVVEREPYPDKRPRMQYLLRGEQSTDSMPWRAGGPVLVLTQGEPTDITVTNRMREATAVHWHGIELESYSDGVVGWSGAAGSLAPPIAPADSFVAHLSLPRPGTFIYHTHLGDMVQIAAGLYGAIVVLPPGNQFDSQRDHVFLAGVNGADDVPYVVVNGDSTASAPLEMKVGETHRLRLIDILPANDIFVSLMQDGAPAQWVPLAKDGADLPVGQRVPRAARTRLSVGETRDVLFTPSHPGELVLRFTPAARFPGWTQRIIVRP